MKLSICIIFLNLHYVLCADPFEAIVRSFLLQAKSMSEKVLSSIAIPTSSDVMFQLDEKDSRAINSLSNFLNTCPPYLPTDSMNGSWVVTHMNKKLLQTTFGDVDQAIDILASGQQLSNRKSLTSIFRDDVVLSCPNITVLSDSSTTSFEFSYVTPKGPKSIIGNLLKLPDRSLRFFFTPNNEFRAIISYRSFYTSYNDIIVLSDLDTYPKCDNYLVLQRSRVNSDDIRLNNLLTSMGANMATNPLLELTC